MEERNAFWNKLIFRMAWEWVNDRIFIFGLISLFYVSCMKDVGHVSPLVDLYSLQPWSLTTFWLPGLHVLYHKRSGSKQTSYEDWGL